MTKERLWQVIRLWMICGSRARTAYLKKHNIYGAIGENVSIMDRKVPLYAKLIRLHNNVHIASNVSFITHDITHVVLNGKSSGGRCSYQEHIGCIEVMDNVFVGSGTIILGDVRIGPNVIVAAGALVNHDVPPDSIVGGVPAKIIGSFTKFEEKRRQSIYPDHLKPCGQNVSEELVQYMWENFNKKRV